MMTSSDLQIVNPSEFKKTMGKFPSGVTVVTVKAGGVTHGMTASAFFSLSLNPPLVAVAVHNQAKLHALLLQSEDFGISILGSHQRRLSDHFAGRHQVSADIEFVDIDGLSLIDGALAHICCSVAARYSGGDHTIYTGLVRCLTYREDCEPLVHYSGNYRSLTTFANGVVG
jgi:flavin reductase (DIM6/NTAB) family NADH-FMN oxidoreductase RutF